MNKQIIVDKNDEIIGYKYRNEITPEDLYRVSCLWLTNSQGDILLTQRGYITKHDPGKWAPAVAGTLDEGETYEVNMVKEIEEEIGTKVQLSDLKLGPKLFLTHSSIPFFCQVFTLVLDKSIEEFTLEKDHVIDAKWYTKEELLQTFKDKPEIFVRNFETIVNEMLH